MTHPIELILMRELAVPPDKLPLSIALQQHRPTHSNFWIRGLDGKRRRITVTAFPLQGQWGEHLGAAAIFWEEP
jgi:hypothetical protein